MIDKEPGKVVSLSGAAIPGEPSEAAIEVVEQLLEKVKSGEIRSVAFAAIKANGSGYTQWRHEGEFFALASSVSWLLHRMHQE